MWMQKHFPEVKFERYADDIIIHCKTEKQAKYLLSLISKRMNMCHLTLHPEKTKVIRIRERRTYNKAPIEQFDFLGFTFRPRIAKTKQSVIFTAVMPAISNKSAKQIREEIRSWKLHLRSESSIEQLAAYVNPIVRGWVQYYGEFYKTALHPPLRQLEQALNSWARRKYKALKGKKTKAGRFLGEIATGSPKLFVHWHFGVKSYAG
jgi:RNA-directed DNA polymerase